MTTEAPLPRLTGEELLPEDEPLPPGLRGRWIWLLRVPKHPNPRRKRDIVKWWERRRLAYNLIVGSFGMVCFAMFVLWTSTRPDSSRPVYFYMFLPIVAGILLNICYTAGWIAEVLGFILGLRGRRIGPTLLIAGMLLSAAAIVLGTL